MPRRKTTEQFIADAVAVHGNKYDYSKVGYVNNRSKILVICPEHGDWRISPDTHLRERGCPQCGNIKRGKNRTTTILKSKDWNFEQPEEYKLIPLTRGKFVKVDNEDFERLKDINWSNSRGYANNANVGLMHRFIMNAPPHLEVDHENHNRLDNRKSNLRLANRAQNNRNRPPNKRSSSDYKGVSRSSKNKKWEGKLTYQGVRYFLGCFEDEIECAKAYDRKALELFGEFAYLNFPELKQEYLNKLGITK